MILQIFDVDNFDIVGKVTCLDVQDISAESLSGIDYFAIEGRRYIITFDYVENKLFFDNLVSDDGLYFNRGIKFRLFDEDHYVYIPKNGGIERSYKSDIIKITGVDIVSRCIKIAQETEIEIHRAEFETLKEMYLTGDKHFPESLDSGDQILNNVPYSTPFIMKYVFGKLGLDYHDYSYMARLPGVEGGYTVLDTGISKFDIMQKVFTPIKEAMFSVWEWHKEPKKIKTQFRMIPDARNQYVMIVAQHYWAGIIKYSNMYRIIEHIYRVQTIIYSNKPLMIDANYDGVTIYDGREQEYYEGIEDPFFETLTPESPSPEIPEPRLLSPIPYPWNMVKWYVMDEEIRHAIVDPDLSWGFESYAIVDDKIKFYGDILLDVWQVDKLRDDEDTTTMKASNILRQILLMGNLALSSDKGKINVVDKSIQLVDSDKFEEATTYVPDTPSLR